MNIRQIETPVTIHSTGSKIGIIDDAKRFVLRQTVNSYSPERFFQLDADLKEIVTALNALATATAKIEALEAKLAKAKTDLNQLSSRSWLKPMTRAEFAKQSLANLQKENTDA